MNRFLILFFISMALPDVAFCEDPVEAVRQSELSRNYRACLNGMSSCNKTVLTTTQVEDVKQAELARNYRACLNGISSCNKTRLTTTQVEDVNQAELARNYRACLNGIPSCNRTILTEIQVEDVQQAELSRNYRVCLKGISSCNKALLTTTQIEDVRQAELARNYRVCLNGIFSCNRTLLTIAQVEDVRQAELDRNYRACLKGLSSCNKSLLKAMQESKTKVADGNVPQKDAASAQSSSNSGDQRNPSSEERRRLEEEGRQNERQAAIDRERQQLAEERKRLEEERRQKDLQAAGELERERQQLAEERRLLEEEKRQREQAKSNQRINLQVSTTTPSSNGAYTITIHTNADTSSLKINDEEIGGSADGRYTVNRIARAGQDTRLEIIATDVYNNTDTKMIVIARKLLSPSAQNVILKPEIIKKAAPRDAVAVIIGIQNYQRVPRAEFADNDAKDFNEYAIRALGIKPDKIKMLVDEDADEINIVKAFENWLPIQVNKEKTDVYVFYSGHGLPAPDGKSLYFLPHGVDKELLSRTAISQNEIVAALVAAKPKSVTMFIDACYSGQTRGGDVLLTNAKPVALKSDAIGYPPNFTVITASTHDQISSSSAELKHGIFSFYLMKGMEGGADENQDGKITVGEMQDYLSEKVARQATTLGRKQNTRVVGDVSKVLVDR